MEIDMNENNWATPCPKYDCKKTACKCGLEYVNIPTSLGDDSESSNVAPKNGAYCNALVVYEANGHVYIYTKEGIPTLIDVDASDISTLEQEVRKAQKDVYELREDIDDFIYGFDTVAQMKAATNLSNGDRVRTLGYYEKNDGGGAFYKVTDTQPSGYYETLSGLLCAELIIEPIMNVEQFGAYGEGTHDDTAAIRAAVSCGAPTVVFMKDKTYVVTPYDSVNNYGIIIPSNTTIDLDGATIQATANDRNGYQIFYFSDCHNSTLKNGKIIGDVETHTGTSGEWGYGVSIVYSTDITLENLYIAKCWGDGININFKTTEEFDSNNITIKDCVCDSNRRQGMSIEAGNNIYVENCQFINTGQIKRTNPSAGVDIEPLIDNKTLQNITFYNCTFKNNRGIQFVGGGGETIDVSNLVIDSCIIDESSTDMGYSFWLRRVSQSSVINSVIKDKGIVVIEPKDDFYFSNNDVLCGRFNVRTGHYSNTESVFENNIFRANLTRKSGVGFFDNYSFVTNPANNTIILSNNSFYSKVSGDYIDSSAINLMEDQGISMAIINNNYVQGARTGIRVCCPSVIKNNIIVGSAVYGAFLGTSERISRMSYVLENNIFQNCGSDEAIIWNYYQKDTVLRNNIYYPYYFSTTIGNVNYTKTKFLKNESPTGYSLIEYNHIFAPEE